MKDKLRKLGLRAKILYEDMDRCDLFRHASAMTYVSLLSLVPTLAAVFALTSLFSPLLGVDNTFLFKAKQWILQRLTTGTSTEIIRYVERIVANLNIRQIGFSGFAGIFITLILLLRQIELAFNSVFGVHQERHALRRFVYFWTFTTLGTSILFIVIGMASGFNINNLFRMGGGTKGIWIWITPIFTFAGLTVFFAALYRLVPNCWVATRNAFSGAVVAAILLTLANHFYGFFISTFTNYRVIYGALAALPIFLLWVYIIWCITLFGSVVVWRSQKGFLSEDHLEFKTQNAVDRQQNFMLQQITPVLILQEIYRQFSQKDQVPLSGTDLAARIKMPDPWIQQALHYLLESHYIVAKEGDDQEKFSVFESRYFPTRPAELVNVRDIFRSDVQRTVEWLGRESTTLPPHVKKSAQRLLQENESSQNLSFAHFTKLPDGIEA